VKICGGKIDFFTMLSLRKRQRLYSLAHIIAHIIAHVNVYDFLNMRDIILVSNNIIILLN